VITVDTVARTLRVGEVLLDCAIGKHGAIAQSDKREGDGKTPLGTFHLRAAYARPDRIANITTGLPFTWLTRQHGWCDDVAHPLYNKPVMLPFAASHEALWREDGLYDILITLSHNDAPAVPGMGSAIFLHCGKYDAAGACKPTLGCVAIPKADLLALCAGFTPETSIEVT
jgi:L,D-peptidoglycan transpeptidase YkuD (ErfK/YbiS/YcfS/YnhG family)